MERSGSDYRGPKPSSPFVRTYKGGRKASGRRASRGGLRDSFGRGAVAHRSSIPFWIFILFHFPPRVIPNICLPFSALRSFRPDPDPTRSGGIFWPGVVAAGIFVDHFRKKSRGPGRPQGGRTPAPWRAKRRLNALKRVFTRWQAYLRKKLKEGPRIAPPPQRRRPGKNHMYTSKKGGFRGPRRNPPLPAGVYFPGFSPGAQGGRRGRARARARLHALGVGLCAERHSHPAAYT